MNAGLIRGVTVVALCLSAGSPSLTLRAGAMTQLGVTHDKTFWQAIAANKFAPPAGVSLPALLDELTTFLGSTDPELRDDIGYTTLAQWIYRLRIVPVDERRRLIGAWTANLTRGIGEQGTPAVLRRSFSALALGPLAILDNDAPYLDREEFDRLLAATLAYLRDERDVRGFDPALGWMHSVAHTGDLLKFLARSRHLRVEQQAAILGGISAKFQSTGTVFIDGEDERVARAVLSIAARDDFDAVAFEAWVKTLSPPKRAAAPTVADRAADQNVTHLVVSLFAVVSADPRPLPQLDRARAILLARLKGA